MQIAQKDAVSDDRFKTFFSLLSVFFPAWHEFESLTVRIFDVQIIGALPYLYF